MSKNIITYGMGIDLEDYYHASIFDTVLSKDDKQALPPSVIKGTEFLLSLFQEYNIKATFFCLGEVALSYPSLIKKIASLGHEIAAHSMHHKRIYNMNQQDFYEDTLKVKNILEDLSGQKVIGYRAPSFSINHKTDFFYSTLESLEFRYSSSLSPIRHDHYGDPTAPRFAFTPKGENILEIPISTIEYFSKRFSIGGGGWFRLMPYMIYRFLVKQYQKNDQPLIFYTHPWEYIPDQPRIKALSLKNYFRHYVNLYKMQRKMKQLCQDFSWGRMQDIIQ